MLKVCPSWDFLAFYLVGGGGSGGVCMRVRVCMRVCVRLPFAVEHCELPLPLPPCAYAYACMRVCVCRGAITPLPPHCSYE